jgi:hypothetical protein
MNKLGRKPIHGHKRRGVSSVEYKTWLSMKRRCYDTKFKDYPNWGGRGIKVCDRWVHDFLAFFEDMGPRPEGKYSIDRLDSDKDYSPENCRWATIQQQGSENRRGLVPVTVDGVFFPSLKKACEHFGVSQTVANMRMRAGIDPAIAVSTVERMKPRRTKESFWPKAKRAAHGLL